jgi:class 3 adenylate cyclase
MPHDKKLSKLPQRKLTTILAADVVGFSRMMGADEDGTYELLGKCRKIFDRNIEHHGGRVFNTAGDSVMAEFGSTVEAVRCAIEIQDEIVAHNTNKPESEQMWFRIGLNVGDVIIEGDDLIGDGVNIASRMESIAIPSGICISGSVYELVHNKLSFAFEDMGRQSVKNIIEPVSAYSLLPAATPHIATRTADKQPTLVAKKRRIGLPVIIAVVFLLGALFAAAYFVGRDSGKGDSVVKEDVTPTPAPAPRAVQREEPVPRSVQKEEPAVAKEPEVVRKSKAEALPLTSITPSLFAGRKTEGATRQTGQRFIIQMKENGDAIVTTYKKNKSKSKHKTETGEWWINKEERVCFEFSKFAGGSKFCRSYAAEGGREWLVSNDSSKSKWVLRAQ